MAIITKIRNQSALLIGAIGISMLLFIVGGDFLTNTTFFQGDTDLGEIAGEKIGYRDFEERLEREITQNYGEDVVDESTRDQARQSLWNMLIQEKVMFREYDEIGLAVSPEELFFQIKTNEPSQRLLRYFTDPQTGRVIEYFANPQTGSLDPEKIVSYLQQLISNQQMDRWIPIEKDLKIDRQNTKYFNLIKKGLYIPSKEAEFDFVSKNKKVNFRYVLKKYEAVPDSSVEVSDKELKSYYDEHKQEPMYQQKESMRSIQYLVFEAIPTDQDKEYLKNTLAELKEKFKNTIEDTLFVKENADTRDNIKYYSAGTLPAEADTFIFNSDSGSVVGPYFENDVQPGGYGYFKLAKSIGVKFVSDSVNARHILIKIANGDTASAQAKADSLKNVIKAKKNFPEMAKQFSEDFGSAQDGGNLNWFTQGMMVKPFNDACFDGAVGDMPVVTSQFGIHLIEIMEKTTPIKKVLTAIVDRKIEPGKKTVEDAYNKASAFSINNNSAEKFNSEGAALGIRQADNLREADKTIGGLDNPREIIRWAFKSDIGDISQVFELGDKFVVANLYAVKEEGTLPFEAVKDLIKPEVIKEKKAEQFISQMSGSASLDQLAGTLNTPVETGTDLTFSSNAIPGVGPEKVLIGKIFTLKQGEMSIPIKGTKGVYVVMVDNITEAVTQGADLKSNIEQISRNLQSRVDYEVFNALQESAKIKDNRGRFY